MSLPKVWHNAPLTSSSQGCFKYNFSSFIVEIHRCYVKNDPSYTIHAYLPDSSFDIYNSFSNREYIEAENLENELQKAWDKIKYYFVIKVNHYNMIVNWMDSN